MILSLNEIDSLAKRATRGAGYSWGLSEEAGKAVRWLHVHGINGTDCLVDLLDMGLAKDHALHRPNPEPTKRAHWQGIQSLCPLATGAYYLDIALTLPSYSVTITNVAIPTLLLPFIGNFAYRNNTPLEINCDGISQTTDGTYIQTNVSFPLTAKRVYVYSQSESPKPYTHASRATLSVDQLKRIECYANLTYAPESEQSRLLGAGAGLSDND